MHQWLAQDGGHAWIGDASRRREVAAAGSDPQRRRAALEKERLRHWGLSAAGKKKLLNELGLLTGYHRKSLLRLLNRRPSPTPDGLDATEEKSKLTPSDCPSPTCRQKAHGTPRLWAARYGVSCTSAVLSSCSNRQLPWSRPVYRVLIAETSCTAIDLAFSGAPTNDPWNNSVIANRDEIVTVDGNAYFPPEALVQGCFRPSRHRTVCGWKREAHTTSTDVVVDGQANANATWFYPEPKDAAAQIKGSVAFWKGVLVS
jgi:uncharacterized protein (DUF427 family)